MVPMPDEINFFDLASLLKIKPDTTMERFGGMLNSSYFDGANIAATLSQKKLITFNTALPGQSIITITDVGKQFIDDANSKAKAEFDHLDLAILTQVSNGKVTPKDIGTGVNVRPKDLAMHLYKLSQQDYATYEFRSGAVSVMLTEKGFAQAKVGMPVKPQAQQPQQAPAMQPGGTATTAAAPMAMGTVQAQSKMMSQAQTAMQGAEAEPGGEQPPEDLMSQIAEQHTDAPKAKGGRGMMYSAIVVVLVIIVVVLYAFMHGYI